MKKRISLLGLGLLPLLGTAQSIAPDVLATSGDHFSNATAQLSYTLGEPMTETVAAGSGMITEGFHQPDLLITAVTSYAPSVTMTIAPNPAGSFFTVSLDGTKEPVNLDVFDTEGRLLLEQILPAADRSTVDISMLPAGVFLLRLSDQSGQLLKTAKLIHSN